jgi:hypothetical protein
MSIELFAAPNRPFDSVIDAARLFVGRIVRVSAVVQAVDDVGPKLKLVLNALFRSEHLALAVLVPSVEQAL